MAVVNVNVLASLERFPNWEHDVELFLPVLGIWKPFGSDKQKLRCFGCVLASRKEPGRIRCTFGFELQRREEASMKLALSFR